MTTITNHSEYIAAVNEAKLHDYCYFTLNAPTISDEEYDRLYFAIQDYETAHPDEVLVDSPTQQCYSENGNGKRQVARRSACLSMKKIHDAKTMVKYLRTQQKACNLSDAVIDVEWKFDGDTVALVYLNGRLAEATYGHGKELMGNDCMEHIKHVHGVPQHVTEWANIDRVEVRGEVIINNANFEAYTGKKKAHRTTCSSFMNKKVAVAKECELLEFHPFRVIGGELNHHRQAMQIFEGMGFLTSGFVDQFVLTADLDTMEQTIEDIVCEAENLRDTLPFPTDGLVFKFDNYEVYDQIGTTDHDAKYNAAFKFRPVFVGETTYRGYHTTIGEKTGKLTYIADYDTITLNGIECSNANCGSEQTFMAKNLKPGDKIQVSLHGDVIPHIDKTLTPALPREEGKGVDTPAVEEPRVKDAEKIEATTDTADLTDTSIEEEIIPDNSRSIHGNSRGKKENPREKENPHPSYAAPEVTPRFIAPEPICAPVITPRHKRESRRGSNQRRKQRKANDSRQHVAVETAQAEEKPSIFAYIFAALAIVSFVVLCVAGLGAAVFFLPLLAGAFK